MGSSQQRMKADNKGARRKGSLPKDQQFVQLINAFRQEPAWLALSFGARCLYVELKALYNGSNNGRLMCSTRFAAHALGCSKNNLTGYFRDLQGKGFIVETKGGSLGSDGRGCGRQWRLTELGFMSDRPTKNYREWAAEKNKTLYQNLGQGVPKVGTVSTKGVPKVGTGCPKGWDGNRGKPTQKCPKNRDDLIYQGTGDTGPESVNGDFIGTPRRFTAVIGGKS